MSDYRHHTATRDRIIFVEVPVAGSPKQKHLRPPDRYPADQRQPWRPQQDIPRRMSKGEKAARLLDSIVRQDADVRAFIDDMRRISAERRASP